MYDTIPALQVAGAGAKNYSQRSSSADYGRTNFAGLYPSDRDLYLDMDYDAQSIAVDELWGNDPDLYGFAPDTVSCVSHLDLNQSNTDSHSDDEEIDGMTEINTGGGMLKTKKSSLPVEYSPAPMKMPTKRFSQESDSLSPGQIGFDNNQFDEDVFDDDGEALIDMLAQSDGRSRLGSAVLGQNWGLEEEEPKRRRLNTSLRKQSRPTYNSQRSLRRPASGENKAREDRWQSRDQDNSGFAERGQGSHRTRRSASLAPADLRGGGYAMQERRRAASSVRRTQGNPDSCQPQQRRSASVRSRRAPDQVHSLETDYWNSQARGRSSRHKSMHGVNTNLSPSGMHVGGHAATDSAMGYDRRSNLGEHQGPEEMPNAPKYSNVKRKSTKKRKDVGDRTTVPSPGATSLRPSGDPYASTGFQRDYREAPANDSTLAPHSPSMRGRRGSFRKNKPGHDLGVEDEKVFSAAEDDYSINTGGYKFSDGWESSSGTSGDSDSASEPAPISLQGFKQF